MRSKGVDIFTRRSNYRELSDYFFKKGNFINAGAYLDSLIQLMDKNSFSSKMTKKKRKGLDRIINLETIIRNNDSILSIVSMNEKEKLNFFNVYIQKVIETDSMKKTTLVQGGVFLEGKKNHKLNFIFTMKTKQIKVKFF